MKIKSRILKSLTAVIALLSIIISIIIIQGCEKNIDNMPYLKLSSSLENLNSQDHEVLMLAKNRLKKYITSDRGRFILKIKSGNQVNISDQLFEYFQLSINNANNKLESGYYIIKGDRVVAEKKIGPPRLKSGPVEGSDGYYYISESCIDYTWYGMDINVSHEDCNALIAGTYSLAYILAKYETGIPAIDAWINCAESLAFFTATLTGVADQGKGYTIVCPLYIPMVSITY